MFIVMDSDRTVYTKRIFNRLAKKDKVIRTSEHFENDQAPAAQMFRSGAELSAQRAEKNLDVNFTCSLQSLWPINKHPDTSKTDFKIGDVMGGVVIRIPVGGLGVG